MEIEAAVASAREVRAPVDVEGRQRRLEREEEGARADRSGAVEELERGEPLLEHRRGVERLAPLEAKVERVGADVLGEEAPREDLAGGIQHEAAFEVLQELLIGIVADRQHAAEAVRQVVRDVVQTHLPPRLRTKDEDAGGSVGHRAESVSPGRRRLRDGDADRGVLVPDGVALEDPGGLIRRTPPDLLGEPERAVGVRVDVGGDVGRTARDPVVREPEVAAAPVAVSDAGHQQPGRPVLLGRPDQVGRVEEGRRARSKRDVLHARVVVERHRRLRE
jgi:hypothetical protein